MTATAAPAPDQTTAETPADVAPTWALVLTIGDVADFVPADARVVDLTPADDSAAAVTAAVRDAGLTPADLRSRALVVASADADVRVRVLATYAALCGFAGRRLDVLVDGQMLELGDFDRLLRSAGDAGRPTEIVESLQVGGPERTDLPRVDLTDGFTPAGLSAIRFARRVRLVPADSTAMSLSQLVAVTAVRGRAGNERFPLLSDGSEALDATDAGLDLHAIRKDSEDLRRSLRGDTRDALADFVAPSPRAKRLIEAAAHDLPTLLAKLGSKSKMIEVPERNSEGELTGGTVEVQAWHCPKPQNHTNGDASPSARILPTRDHVDGFRCLRCLPERVDALRLVMWALGYSADEAADWILAG